MPSPVGLLLALASCTNDNVEATAESEAPAPVTHVVERGDYPSLYLPYDEELVFGVVVDASLFETSFAQVVMRSKVEEYRPPLIGARPEVVEANRGKKTSKLELHATGEKVGYKMDSLMEANHYQRDWPSLVYRYVSTGTDKRRRELTAGRKDDGFRVVYRRDTSRDAPRGTRIWAEPLEREVPEDGIDMLTSIYLIRTMMKEELSKLAFHMIDKHRVWEVELTRGREAVIRTDAGEFRGVEVLMNTRRPPGEEEDEDEFKGPFGLSGTIHLWVERETGVPVRIEGDLPTGLITLGVDILLKDYRGTPPEFRPIGAGAPATAPSNER